MLKAYKSPSALVLRQLSGNGLQLTRIGSPQSLKLDTEEASLWTEWDTTNVAWPKLAERLRVASFLEERESCPLPELPQDGIKLYPDKHFCHSYSESPDLCILFNAALMNQNNPLLALGPYGSLCWNGAVAGQSIGKIRTEAWRVFGKDVVLEFLEWLHSLGFFVPHSGLSMLTLHPPSLPCEFAAPNVQFRLEHADRPWYCLWEINTICDLQCRLCYLPHFDSIGPDLQQTEHILEQILKIGIFYVVLLGGEPLLRTDLDMLIRRLRKAGVFVKLITNGMQLTPRRAEMLAEAGLNQLEVSFDGLSAETHDVSRGLGTFPRACRAVEIARTVGIPRCGIVWTIHSGNFAELPNLPQFLSHLEINECYLSVFRKSGLRGCRAPYDSISVDELRHAVEQAQRWKSIYPQLTIVVPTQCSCGRTSLVIGYNGDLRVCPSQYNKIGNLYKSSLAMLWKNQEENITTNGPLGFCAEQPTPLNQI